MANSILLQRNSRVYLLLRGSDRLHIITVNSKLDDAKEEKLLAGTCSEAVMDEMGLTRETVMKCDLRGVAVGGCYAGSVIVLYTRGKKLKYVLTDDYTAGELDTIFSGIERFMPPAEAHARSPKTDWRKEKQQASVWRIMKPLGAGLNLAGIVCFGGTCMMGSLSTFWSTFSLLVIAASLVLYCLFPQYFSIMGKKEYKRAGYTAEVKQLTFAIMAPAMVLMVRGVSAFYFFSWKPILIGGAVAGLAVSLVLLLFSRELRESKSIFFVAVILAMLMSGGVLGQVNHMANRDTAPAKVYTVIDTDRTSSSKGGNSYYCIVALESDQEIRLPIGAGTYRRLQPGDEVTVYVGRGGLGIEYAYFVGIPE